MNQLKVPSKPTGDAQASENDSTKWKLLLYLKEIMTALIKKNMPHFEKSHGTLFISDPLSSIFGIHQRNFKLNTRSTISIKTNISNYQRYSENITTRSISDVHEGYDIY